jgi:natural product biosynthesis luciferase-like monooxygenase protein
MSTVATAVLPPDPTAAVPPAVPATPEFFRFPATSAQQRIWFLEQFHPGSPLHNIPIAVRLEGELDVPALAWALNAVVRRHEILRTSFARWHDAPVQIVAPALTVPLPVQDLSALTAVEREAQAFRLAREQAHAAFDVGSLPLLRAQLLRLAATEHIFVLTVHHIVFDGWSLAVFFRDLRVLYAGKRSGQPLDGPELPIQYADYAVWQHERRRAHDESVDWWRQQLGAEPAPLELPSDRPRPAVATYRGAVERLALPAALHTGLVALSRRENATLFMTLLAAWLALLHRHSGQDEILVASPVAGRDETDTEKLVGLFINTLVLRGDLAGDPAFPALLARVRETVLGALAHAETPFDKLVEALHPTRSTSRAPLAQVMFALEQPPVGDEAWPGLTLTPLELDSGTAKFDLTLYVAERPDGLLARLEYSTDLFDAGAARRLLTQFRVLLEGIVANARQKISELPLLTEAERQQLLVEWNDTHVDYPRDQTIAEVFAAQVARTPDAIAVVFGELQFTYRELAQRSDHLAADLQRLGVKPGALVGVCLERSLDLMVALLGILKAGGAYLPLDPKFPPERLAYIVGDAHAVLVLTQQEFLGLLPEGSAKLFSLDTWDSRPPMPVPLSVGRALPEQPAYVLYTSGSTGNPKGVAVSHRNVVNFFAGMDRALGFKPGDAPGCWLAVTTISFDISVLELFWTLTRGFKVVIHAEAPRGGAPVAAKQLDFSLFYFASEAGDAHHDKYHLMIEGAKFADTHGFSAVWTPERHFHSFGGPFPNPSVTSAAIAMATQRVQIRAGSIVLPLHQPIRVAEEWAVVDNLSHGRVGVAMASGWHEDDFVFAPQDFARRKELVVQNLELVRRLWRGEAIKVRNGAGGEIDIRIHPRPVQAALPVWLTSSGHIETFRTAGELGANVLTHLVGQNVNELAEKIRAYREAWRRHGHGSGEGCVTLMLHTFIGRDTAAVRAIVHGPLCAYLETYREHSRAPSRHAASEPRPAPKLAEAQRTEIIEAAFDRYFDGCGLFGTPERCTRFLDRLQSIGVDEIACFIDFGVPADTVLANLEHLNRLRERCQRHSVTVAARRSVAEQIVHHGVTHLQCTPSLAKTLVADAAGLGAVRQLHQLLLGGEALPVALAEQLHHELPGRIYNMYGPTETTVWSASHRLEKIENPIPIGRPIANTRIYILDRALQPTPVGVPGELFIGGDGVALGYLHRLELTAEKFLRDPFASVPDARMYRTGDLARYRANGVIEFLGRVDHQVKLRGHRIELGEIETVLRKFPAVRETVVVAREVAPGDQRLVAYFVSAAAPPPSDAELRDFLRVKLPDYMMPAMFVPLEKLPLTPNGKIDRRALPVPALDRARLDTAFVAPSAGAEETIAAVWEEVLAVQRPGANDNFFDLGGHSLNVVQVQGKLRERLGREVPLLTFFQHPTIRALARSFEANANGHGDGAAFHDKIRARAEKQRAAARPRGLAAAARADHAESSLQP